MDPTRPVLVLHRSATPLDLGLQICSTRFKNGADATQGGTQPVRPLLCVFVQTGYRRIHCKAVDESASHHLSLFDIGLSQRHSLEHPSLHNKHESQERGCCV
ncbi:hypothetical protein RF55_25854 [Lasius niger]|uniref:Uncharacterized protein n=1 Tax=Lasius niger TaxID=67767 RepID=A0A0J7JTI8_LASNI|nr:hypothetical protein RF55_25854 [Lasius niger]